MTTRTPLDRDRILEVAIRLLDEGGLRALSARSIAKSLDVTAMALYRHFPSIEAILGAVFDRVVGDAAITDHDEPEIEAWLHTTFVRIHKAMAKHAALVGVLGTEATFGPNALTVVEQSLARLSAHGVQRDHAIDVFHSLLSFTVGAAAIEAGVRSHIEAKHSPLGRFGGRTRFARELDVLVRAQLASRSEV